MSIVTVGSDLAKNVFVVRGVDDTGKPALVRPEVARAKLLELIASLPPCLIGREACAPHRWAPITLPAQLQPLVTIGAAVTQIPCRHGTNTIPPQMPDIRLQALSPKPN